MLGAIVYILMYGTTGAGSLSQYFILTESSNEILTETSDQLLTEDA